MNKYELVIVLNGNLEDEARAAVMERVNSYITRFGGTVENVDDNVVPFHSSTLNANPYLTQKPIREVK